MLKTLLVANRGEIARRIFRTARKMGLRTIAVYSEADKEAPFVQDADEAHLIGPASPRDSYLKIEAVLDVARRTGADAVHPGYGFLSENAAFARAVQEAGLCFVGPDPATIQSVGGKLDARELARTAGVPVVPGSGPLTDPDEARTVASKIGYPVMIKASAGGGGIGMTLVSDEKKLPRALEDAQRKGATFFGSDIVYIEKFIPSPAHVEVQILGDHEGRVVAIGDRDCTVQRRNQKVIEEAPSPRLSAATRQAMLEAAQRLGEASAYVNAGTVEMIYCGSGDSEGSYYFLEVNSRLQVEHPVTEMVTGLDLVEHQIRIAAGESLPSDWVLSGVPTTGHAIEARVCAEDPDRRFLPKPGRLGQVTFASGEHLRVDSGVETGSEISSAYDSLMAKMIAWGEDRDAALDRLKDGLSRTILEGASNLSLFPRVLDHPLFRQGRHDTSFLASELGLKS